MRAAISRDVSAVPRRMPMWRRPQRLRRRRSPAGLFLRLKQLTTEGPNMHLKGKAWTFGRNINTDLIFPKMWFRPAYEPGEMASHLMVGIDEEFPRKVGRGDIIVGGQNVGCG